MKALNIARIRQPSFHSFVSLWSGKTLKELLPVSVWRFSDACWAQVMWNESVRFLWQMFEGSRLNSIAKAQAAAGEQVSLKPVMHAQRLGFDGGSVMLWGWRNKRNVRKRWIICADALLRQPFPSNMVIQTPGHVVWWRKGDVTVVYAAVPHFCQ